MSPLASPPTSVPDARATSHRGSLPGAATGETKSSTGPRKHTSCRELRSPLPKPPGKAAVSLLDDRHRNRTGSPLKIAPSFSLPGLGDPPSQPLHFQKTPQFGKNFHTVKDGDRLRSNESQTPTKFNHSFTCLSRSTVGPSLRLFSNIDETVVEIFVLVAIAERSVLSSLYYNIDPLVGRSSGSTIILGLESPVSSSCSFLCSPYKAYQSW